MPRDERRLHSKHSIGCGGWMKAFEREAFLSLSGSGAEQGKETRGKQSRGRAISPNAGCRLNFHGWRDSWKESMCPFKKKAALLFMEHAKFARINSLGAVWAIVLALSRPARGFSPAHFTGCGI